MQLHDAHHAKAGLQQDVLSLQQRNNELSRDLNVSSQAQRAGATERTGLADVLAAKAAALQAAEVQLAVSHETNRAQQQQLESQQASAATCKQENTELQAALRASAINQDTLASRLTECASRRLDLE